MKIYVVGSVLKDVYLDLDTQREPLEADQNGTKWLNMGFDTSEHHFFNRTSSYGGAAISLEVLGRMGVSAEVIGSDMRLENDGLVTDTPAGAYRYILVAEGQVSYLVPDEPAKTTFNAPVEPVEWIFVDRSANLDRESAAGVAAYLDISSTTRLALYVKNPADPCYDELIEHADLIFVEGEIVPESVLSRVTPDKIIRLAEREITHQNSCFPLSVERIDMLTHLSVFSVASATILGGYVLGRPLSECAKLAVANVENARLNAVLPLEEMEKIARETPEKTNKNEDLELVAASLVYPGKGILAADESGGSIAKKFASMGIPDNYDTRRDYRNIFFTTPQIEQFVNGVILFDETSKQAADNGQNFVDFLTAKRVIPGIKVDQGLACFDNSIETYTKGLEGLPERLAEYRNRGLRFAKWRAAFEIRVSNGGEIITPTERAVDENCVILAKYALECQKAGIVPIVEPEVVYNGYYSLEQNKAVTGRILDVLFEKLRAQGVNLKACILKVNMVINGKTYEKPASTEEVGAATAEVLKTHVPEELAGVVFLSGGQTVEQATENLAAVEKQGPFPWPVTFSFARALQDPALDAWRGNNANAEAARMAFLERLKANCQALVAVEFGKEQAQI